MKTQFLTRITSGSIAIILLLIFSTSCTDLIDGVSGNGNVATETREVADFSKISAGGAFEIFLEQGNTEALTIDADENLLPLINTNVSNGVLEIASQRPIRNASTLNVFITIKDISAIDVSGACSVISKNTLDLEDLVLEGSGATFVDLVLNSRSFSADLSGANEVRVSGETDIFSLELSGASKIRAFDFVAREVKIQASGAADAHVHATEYLNAEVSGAASISYMGNPSIDQRISGAGSIRKK
jgi:hypothetical protein